MKVHVPESVDEVVSLLDTGTVLAGGTHLIARHVPAKELVSLRRAGLAGIARDGDRVTLGAATTLAQVGREVEFLRDAVESIASPSIRNLATVGGNLFVPQPHGDFDRLVELHRLDRLGQTGFEALQRLHRCCDVARRGRPEFRRVRFLPFGNMCHRSG